MGLGLGGESSSNSLQPCTRSELEATSACGHMSLHVGL